ncbi:MAG: hypothetical protein H0X66_10860 [Verrucomicrobia bacterium]|nr:hypothetical protein [Verrucomicrobiota bacterium]
MHQEPPAQQTQQAPKQVIIVQSTKSVGVAILLSFFFGPLGMFYSTVSGAVVMIFANLVAVFLTLGIGLVLTWPIGMIWAARAASAHNKKLLTGVN